MIKKRDLGLELLNAIQEIKANKGTKRQVMLATDVCSLRGELSLTQVEMATILRVSTRTLQEWEQGRRKPSGPAQALLHIMHDHPEIFVQ